MTASASRSFVRNLWRSFLVYTAATGLMFWWCQAMPPLPGEMVIGRGVVVLAVGTLWIVGFVMTLALWRSACKAEMSRGSSLGWSAVFWVLAAASAGFVVSEIRPWNLPTFYTGNERNAFDTLRAVVGAEADFRNNDRDGNKVPDYWVADVSGLYCLVPASGGEVIKLIDLSTVGADETPVAPSRFPRVKPAGQFGVKCPKAGFWYRALTSYVDETGAKRAYDAGDGRNRDRFGFVAFPDSRSAGERALIVNEKGAVYWRKFTVGEVPDTFPGDPLREGWRKVD